MKNKNFRRNLILTKAIILFLMCGNLSSLFASSNDGYYDTTRIFHAMDRARNGEDITIVVIGGSITAGHAATSTANRWANKMTDWWITTFPTSTINLINMGMGGTGSDIGTHRMQKDVLDRNPDFIVVEFAVNDEEPNVQSEKMMEGLIRQALADSNLPGVMILSLMQMNGSTADSSHKLVADYYDVPLVSFADSIQVRVDRDGIPLSDAFNDVTHPNDVGMQYIADFLIEELNIIHDSLPASAEIPEINTSLPAPRLTDTYANCYMYRANSLVPETNNGWSINGTRWTADEVDDEISFTVDGNSISIVYTRFLSDTRGQVDIWVDNMTPKTLDAYWTETWGTGNIFALIEEDLPDGEHTLHIKVNENNTGGGDGHFFEIININKAGNWDGLAPISNAGDNAKTVIGTVVTLDGSASSHPEDVPIETFNWTIVSAPAGNTDAIDIPTDTITSITPNTAGLYEIGLIVGSGGYSSVQDIKTINVKASNQAPVAVAGNDTTVSVEMATYLSGLGSYDPDDDGILYSWTMLSQPAGEDPSLNLTDTPSPRFFPRELGQYVIELVVNDSIISSAPDQITITAAIIDAIETNTTPDFRFVSFPNPASDLLKVSYILPSQQDVILTLHAVDGRQLIILKEENQRSGEHLFEIDLSDFQVNEGIYFLKLSTNEGSQILKVIKGR